MRITIDLDLTKNKEIESLMTDKVIECLKGIKLDSDIFQKIIVDSIEDYDFGDIVYEAVESYVKNDLKNKFK